MHDISVFNTRIEIHNFHYNANNMGRLERSLSFYERDQYKYTMHTFLYDAERNTLCVPKGLGVQYIQDKLKHDNIFINTTNLCDNKATCPKRMTSVTLKKYVAPRDDLQEKAINFMIKDFNNTQRTINLATGKGKTFCTIYSIITMGYPAIIISGNLSEQWIREIMKFTDSENDDVERIRGRESIDDLMSRPPTATFYVASTNTLTSYIKNGGDLQAFFDHLNIRIKVIDEVHINFEANVKIDLRSNVLHNWYLTATLGRSDTFQDRMFKYIYDFLPNFGKSTTTSHFNIYLITYNTFPQKFQIKMCTTRKGFNAHIYFRYLFKSSNKVLFLYKLMSHFVKRLLDYDTEARALIVLSRTSDIEIIHTMFKTIDNLDSGQYCTIIPNIKDRKKELEKQIILSTLGSCNAGLDIPNLRLILCICPFGSPILVKQLMGRLREIEGKEVYYCDFVDMGFKDMVKQRTRKMPVFKQKTQKALRQIQFTMNEVLKHGISR